ncbi:MAG: stage III sporulation protein AD [Bacillaceae bacterium]|nr:stage III sporulation protein AD [Bacillaceae bacterium]
MDFFQLVSFALIASILVIIVKEQQSSIAFFLVLLTGIIIFLVLIQYISEIFRMITYVTTKANLNFMYVETILKIIGIAYIAEFGAQMTRDAGLGSLAAKIELAGKVFILLLAIPIITSVIETVLNFIPV